MTGPTPWLGGLPPASPHPSRLKAHHQQPIPPPPQNPPPPQQSPDILASQAYQLSSKASQPVKTDQPVWSSFGSGSTIVPPSMPAPPSVESPGYCYTCGPQGSISASCNSTSEWLCIQCGEIICQDHAWVSPPMQPHLHPEVRCSACCVRTSVRQDGFRFHSFMTENQVYRNHHDHDAGLQLDRAVDWIALGPSRATHRIGFNQGGQRRW